MMPRTIALPGFVAAIMMAGLVGLGTTGQGVADAAAAASTQPPKGSRVLIGPWVWRDLDETLSNRGRPVGVRFLARRGRLFAKFPESRAERVAWNPKGRRFAFAADRKAQVAGQPRVRVVYRGRVTPERGRGWVLSGALRIPKRQVGASAFEALRRPKGSS